MIDSEVPTFFFFILINLLQYLHHSKMKRQDEYQLNPRPNKRTKHVIQAIIRREPPVEAISFNLPSTIPSLLQSPHAVVEAAIPVEPAIPLAAANILDEQQQAA